MDPSLVRNRTWLDAVRAHRLRSAAAALAIVLILVAVIPPLRSVATFAASKVILVVTTPFAPSVKGLNTAPESSRVVAADGSPLGAFEEGERLPVRVADLPPHVKGAVLAAEDADFYRHDGVDPSAIVRATLNMATGSKQQGGSTITQQLAKLNYTSGERTVFRKLREVLYATRLERDYSKDQLLERYLNQVYLGDSTYGIEAAARRTFGVPAAQLTPDQAAALAVRIRSPGNIDPRKNPDSVLSRRNAVLEAMAGLGTVPKEQLSGLQGAPLKPIPLPPAKAKPERLVVDRARREALKLDVLGGDQEDRLAKLEGGGLIVETALDPKGQKAARDAAQAALPRPEDPSAAVVSVQPGDGAIRVLLGDSKGGQFDVATQGRRQPGSSFKPFTYAAALEEGIHPGTTYDSKSPQTFSYNGSSFQVQNAEEGTGGQMTFDEATVGSVNVVYMQVALKVGPDKVKKVAERLGEPNDLEAVPSLALGGEGKGVSPLDQAAAYATFASGGTYAEPYLVTRIKDNKGKVVWQHDKKTRKGMDQKEAGVINGVLQRVVNEGTGKAAAFGRPVAGKTGTTNDSKDVWFVGYTPQLATAVWVGNVEGPKPLTDGRGRPLFGGGPPARIFSSTMKAALQGVKETPFQVNKPEDLGLKLGGAGGGGTTSPTAPPSSVTSTTAPPLLPDDSTPPTQPPNTFVPSDPQGPIPPTTTRPTPTGRRQPGGHPAADPGAQGAGATTIRPPPSSTSRLTSRPSGLSHACAGGSPSRRRWPPSHRGDRSTSGANRTTGWRAATSTDVPRALSQSPSWIPVSPLTATSARSRTTCARATSTPPTTSVTTSGEPRARSRALRAATPGSTTTAGSVSAAGPSRSPTAATTPPTPATTITSRTAEAPRRTATSREGRKGRRRAAWTVSPNLPAGTPGGPCVMANAVSRKRAIPYAGRLHDGRTSGSSRQEEWQDSPQGWPQSPTYSRWVPSAAFARYAEGG